MNSTYERMLVGLKAVAGNVGEGWFIIMEEPDSERFVQFAFDEGQGLVFDCPTISFDEEELARATRVMEKFGIRLESPSGDDFTSFCANIGMNLDLGARIASETFREVFMFPDNTSFDISINK